MSNVVVIKTGVANTASMLAALGRLGASPVLSSDPREVESASHVVLPGVGSFGAGMAALHEHRLVGPLLARLRDGRPTLCVCLGLQLLAESSEESPGVRGLGFIPGFITRFQSGGTERPLRVPQMGWNFVTPWNARAGFWAYYANSYCLRTPPPGFECATTCYDEQFVACFRDRGVLACQFHPELSGLAGLGFMREWLEGSFRSSREVALENNAASAREQSPWILSSRPDAAASPERTRIIPCLDVRDSRVVKGVQFQGLRDAGDPAELAGLYESHGADELVMLDVSATPDSRATATDTIRAIRRRLSIPLTVGGGVRSIDDAMRLLDAGADKVGVNTAAVRDPSIISSIAKRFGVQCTVIAIDAKRDQSRAEHAWRVVVRSGTEATTLDAIDWARACVERGAGEILLTSMDRDGTHAGYDLELLRAVSDVVHVPVIASGGAGGPEHLVDAIYAGADAVLAASIFHDAKWTVEGVKQWLAQRGIPLRMEINP
ncbi:MAG: imidazole glycerol phosphate synthase subunit HisF [Phycisphaerales bacterium]|nr:imidazole glycerol phosphate synthase subunit HisF [Phycisphaerales bacterium]